RERLVADSVPTRHVRVWLADRLNVPVLGAGRTSGRNHRDRKERKSDRSHRTHLHPPLVCEVSEPRRPEHLRNGLPPPGLLLGVQQTRRLRQYAVRRIVDQVRRLSERDASAVLSFVVSLSEFDDPLPFTPRVLAGLQKLIPSDVVAYSELDPLRRS